MRRRTPADGPRQLVAQLLRLRLVSCSSRPSKAAVAASERRPPAVAVAVMLRLQADARVGGLAVVLPRAAKKLPVGIGKGPA